MAKQLDMDSEYNTGDQPTPYRNRRRRSRSPSWVQVDEWRERWSPEKVALVLDMLGRRASAEDIGRATGFGTVTVKSEMGRAKEVPDLRGLDVARLPPEKRCLSRYTKVQSMGILDLSYAQMNGARLTGLDLSDVNLARARLKKATLRRVNLSGATLTKAHLEDADLRDAILDDAHLGHIRYTEDGWWYRGTVFMETHLNKAQYVDPLLERYARDQYYLYVLKYRNRDSLMFKTWFGLWWVMSNFGKSWILWALWSLLFAMVFAVVFYYLGPSHFAVDNLAWNFKTVVYYSVVTFTTLGFGDVTPCTQTAAWWVMAEVIVGYVMLGGLISIFSTKLARRS